MIDSKILKIAKKTQTYVTKNKNIPATIKVDNVKYNYGTLNHIFANTIIDNKTKLQNKTINNAPAPTGDKINETLTQKQYTQIAKTLTNFTKKNNRNPNYILQDNYKINPLLLIDVFSRILVFAGENNRLPRTATINSNIIKKNKASPIQNKDTVFNYFVKVFGNVTTIDGAFQKVKDRGYGYYYNDYLSNKQTIDHLKNGGQKPNCTDTCQLFWHIAKALGYDVQILHVKCSGGDGHVRMKLRHKKHTGGNWIHRDPACIVSDNGRPLTDIWCGNGTLLAVNPSWFMENVNR